VVDMGEAKYHMRAAKFAEYEVSCFCSSHTELC
jgi:hypothetical protein